MRRLELRAVAPVADATPARDDFSAVLTQANVRHGYGAMRGIPTAAVGNCYSSAQ